MNTMNTIRRKYTRNFVRTRRERDIQSAGLKQKNNYWQFNGELIRNIINTIFFDGKGRNEK